MEVAWRCPTGTGPNPSRSCPSCSRNRPITTPGGTRWKRIPSRAATSTLLAATLCVTRSQSYSRPLRMARTLFFSMRSVRWHGAFGLVFLYFSVCVCFFFFCILWLPFPEAHLWLVSSCETVYDSSSILHPFFNILCFIGYRSIHSPMSLGYHLLYH